jgi:hypothetical protein
MRLRTRPLVGVLAIAAVGLPLSVPSAAAHGGDGEVFLRSAVAVDRMNGTVTLPLHRGTHDGRTVWFVVTESSDKEDAERRGVNFAEKLENALGTRAVQRATVRNGRLSFAGTVDFAPARVVVPGPAGFPPVRAEAGAIADADYSPLVTVDGRIVLNASQVANGTGRHDAVVSIDFARRRVTLDTLNGFYEDNRVQYLHQEASVELVAAVEGSTWTPRLDAAPGVGSNDRDTSARSAILPIVNGPRGAHNPQRQGLQSALLGQGDPLNVTQEVPDNRDYSPIWDVTPVVWTSEAIRDGERRRLRDHEDIADLAEDGVVVSAGMGRRNEELGGLRALPAISNCPVVIEFG